MLAIAWITNLYNFMDGSDGLAGGMTLIGFGAYALAALLGRPCARLRAVCLALAAAAAGASCSSTSIRRASSSATSARFRSAFSPARSACVGWRDDVWPLWFPLLVFGPFIGDATLTLLKRACARRARLAGASRALLPAHGAHGLGHRGTALIGYAADAVCAAAALSAASEPPCGAGGGHRAAAVVAC